ncbi:hypothetical protein LTR99_007118 [Exophiala xenobiotica]|uniref:Phytanoyl-CoA dioxygenase n=1 Tax=Vermiconidia calcicola TaxID=1690605 RepID=A0AAV9PSS4_9PEZI|nr:hypothetical protein LTR72_006618 [Exophiala xenobiotica]KAK5528910.1 hypothetical protein LTR25_010095 [Vermiconidia calcicola]KAK5544922.1 hypothetical protein LTR23_004051 [Chaetothyriales sp. CCFEE 6169]KAK5269682.1 hypothetical protein LTR96_005380 [Exophiala xenobiotica]KAK5287250.1 hypothetical protein LTR14_009314 [Exophiala xenobiotica]
MGEFVAQARRLAFGSKEPTEHLPAARVKRLSRSAPLSLFIEALEQDGCVIIKDFTDEATLKQADKEVRPWLGVEDEGAVVGALQGKTKTVTRLIGRSPTVREQFFANPIYQDLCEHFLALNTTHWYGDKPLTTTSHPLLSISITFDIPPGTSAQGLHRDDKNHHARHTKAESYEIGRDILLGLFVPACNTSKANGATRVVPGSHLWGDEMPDFGDDGSQGVVDAEMQMGEAFIMLGSLYHGGGAYDKPLGTAKEGARESRTVHAMFSCTGVQRQEEISFLSYPIEEVKTYSKIVQERLGWKQSEPNLGWVDLKSPEFLLAT